MKQRHRRIAAFVTALALVVPATAIAKAERSGKGKGEKGAKDKRKGGGKVKGVKLAKANVRGTVVSVEGTTIVVTVAKANSHARGCLGRQLSFELSGARLKTGDHNADGSRDAADLLPGHSVAVHAMVPRVKGSARKRSCTAGDAGTLAARKVANRTKVVQPADEQDLEGEDELEGEQELESDEGPEGDDGPEGAS